MTHPPANDDDIPDNDHRRATNAVRSLLALQIQPADGDDDKYSNRERQRKEIAGDRVSARRVVRMERRKSVRRNGAGQLRRSGGGDA